METDPLHWHPGYYRRPEWRLLRAQYLLATGRRRDRRIDDAWVDHARAALTGRTGGGSSVAAVRASRNIWTGDSGQRAELEARLLSASPFDQITSRMGLPVGVVEAYAEVFFAVRPMLQATDWVLTRAVGYCPLRGFIDSLPSAAWKLSAFVGGNLFLDVVIAATTSRPLPAGFLSGRGPIRGRSGVGRTTSRPLPAGFLSGSGSLLAYEETRVRLHARLWIAAMAAATDDEFARVVKARRLLRVLDARIGRRSDPVIPGLAAAESFLVALPGSRRKGRVRVGLNEQATCVLSSPARMISPTAMVTGLSSDAICLTVEIDSLIASLLASRLRPARHAEVLETDSTVPSTVVTPLRTREYRRQRRRVA